MTLHQRLYSFGAAGILSLLVLFLFFISSEVWAQKEYSGRDSALVEKLKSKDISDRKSALKEILAEGIVAKEAVPELKAMIKDNDVEIRSMVVMALGNIGFDARSAISLLGNRVLEDENPTVRAYAVEAIGRMGKEAVAAIPTLIQALKTQDVDIRIKAAVALANINSGETIRVTITSLTDLLKNNDEKVRTAAGDALIIIADQLHDREAPLSIDGLTESIEVLEKALIALQASQEFTNKSLVVIKISWLLGTLRTEKEYRLTDRVIATILQSKGTVGTLAYVVSLLIVWLIVLWIRPLLLLKINDALRPYTDITLPPQFGSIKISARTAILISFFQYSSRVLDAWIAEHIAIARENFWSNPTAKDRMIYVDVQVSTGDGDIFEFSAKQLQPLFRKDRICLLITGGGGTGKTSLACQVAKWAISDDQSSRLCPDHLILPVLIEQDLSPSVKGEKDILVETIRGRLSALINKPEGIPEDLLLQLLRKRRILVIVDGFSELSDEMRKRIRPDVVDFPIAALMITSRFEESLHTVPKTVISTQLLRSDKLVKFLVDYLTKRGKAELFEDRDYFKACENLELMKVTGDKEITVLIARLYADSIIDAKEHSTHSKLPRTIPDLMLNYVSQVNDKITEGRLGDDIVMWAVKVIAWECLKQTNQPESASRVAVINKLTRSARATLTIGVNVTTLLEYLCDRLRLIRSTGPVKDQVRFNLDPLAEYLAGLYIVEKCGSKKRMWQKFIKRLDNQFHDIKATKSFLLALRDCYYVKESEYKLPTPIVAEFIDNIRLDSNDTKTVQLERRVRRLMANLRGADVEDRLVGIDTLRKIGDKLRKIGQEAKSTNLALIELLKDSDPTVRSRAAMALGEIGPEAISAAPELVNALKDHNEYVRSSSAIALGEIGSKAEFAIPALVEALRDQSAIFRCGAAYALGRIRCEARITVPELIDLLKDQHQRVRSSAVCALGEFRDEARDAVPLLIEMLRDQDEDVRISVTYALNQIYPGKVPLNAP